MEARLLLMQESYLVQAVKGYYLLQMAGQTHAMAFEAMDVVRRQVLRKACRQTTRYGRLRM